MRVHCVLADHNIATARASQRIASFAPTLETLFVKRMDYPLAVFALQVDTLILTDLFKTHLTVVVVLHLGLLGGHELVRLPLDQVALALGSVYTLRQPLQDLEDRLLGVDRGSLQRLLDRRDLVG